LDHTKNVAFGRWQQTSWMVGAASATLLLSGLGAAGCMQSADAPNQATAEQEVRAAQIDLGRVPTTPETGGETAARAAGAGSSTAVESPTSDAVPEPEDDAIAASPEPSPALGDTLVMQTRALWTQPAAVSDSDPMRMAVDDAGGVWIAVYRSSSTLSLTKYDPDGAQLWTRTITATELGVTNFDGVTQVAVDHVGDAYVAVPVHASGSSLLKYDAAGSRIGAHAFDRISELAIGVDNQLGVVMSKVGPDGVASYFVGQYGVDATLQWIAPLSTFPFGLVADASGTLHLLRRSGSHLDSSDREDSPFLLERFDHQGQRLLSVVIANGSFASLDRSGTVYAVEHDLETLHICSAAFDGTLQCTTQRAPNGFAFHGVETLYHSAFMSMSLDAEPEGLGYRIEYGAELEPQPMIQLGSCEVESEHLTDSKTFYVVVASNCPSAVEKRTL
jgi:hypothetical protein